MESTAQTGNRRRFRSPNRILARFFRKSRDRWKQKCQAVKGDLKRRSNELADVRRSREAWRQKAEEAQAEAKHFQEQVERLQKELQAEQAARQEAEKKGAC